MGQTSKFSLAEIPKKEDFNSRLQPRDFSQAYQTAILDYSEYPFFFQEIPRAPGESTWRFSAMVAIAGHRTGPQFRSHRAKKKLDTVIWKVVPFEAPFDS